VLELQGPVRFFCQDETRLGRQTSSGRKIITKGVKPKGKVQWQFKATYLYGIVEPATGEHFFYEFTHLNSDCFQVFLELVSERFHDSILIMQLDQAGAHKAKRFKLPPHHCCFNRRMHPKPIRLSASGSISSWDCDGSCRKTWMNCGG
jgi:hypothetical protein